MKKRRLNFRFVESIKVECNIALVILCRKATSLPNAWIIFPNGFDEEGLDPLKSAILCCIRPSANRQIIADIAKVELRPAVARLTETSACRVLGVLVNVLGAKDLGQWALWPLLKLVAHNLQLTVVFKLSFNILVILLVLPPGVICDDLKGVLRELFLCGEGGDFNRTRRRHVSIASLYHLCVQLEMYV